MKLFDYKFLILLALTLVVYFIHKEVEKLRARIVKLESNCKPIMKLEQVLEEKNNTLVYSEQAKQNVQDEQTKQNVQDEQTKQNVQDEQNIKKEKLESDSLASSTSSTKKISLDIKAETVGEIIVQQDENTTTDIISTNKEETKNDSATSSSQHLAIYSNDNETSNDNISVLDSVLSKDISQDQNKEISQDQNKENVVIITHEKLDYDKMKIHELKKVAEDLGLTVTKKVNGQYKPKNKQELLNEIKNKK